MQARRQCIPSRNQNCFLTTIQRTHIYTPRNASIKKPQCLGSSSSSRDLSSCPLLLGSRHERLPPLPRGRLRLPAAASLAGCEPVLAPLHLEPDQEAVDVGRVHTPYAPRLAHVPWLHLLNRVQASSYDGAWFPASNSALSWLRPPLSCFGPLLLTFTCVSRGRSKFGGWRRQRGEKR